MNDIYKALLNNPNELEFTIETNVGKKSLTLSRLINSGFIYSDKDTYIKSAELALNGVLNTEKLKVSNVDLEDFYSYHVEDYETPNIFNIHEFLSIYEEIHNEISKIAKKELFIGTLRTRGSDSLDFHDTAVWSLEKALKDAYLKGLEANNLELTEDNTKSMKM